MPVTPVQTPRGTAELHIDEGERGWLVLGHGAGGGVDAPDLLAARGGALAAGWGVVRVQQPWRVAGRRVAEPPPRLDEAWLAALAGLTGPLVLGGRSAGARVACRTATELQAVAVLCLAFPLHPPGRPERSRLDELRRPTVPRLVVQGDRDAFGVPLPEPGIEVHLVAGADHAMRTRKADGRSAAEVSAEIATQTAVWLQTLT
ncbi:MAG: alpha/beta hydrolase [Mycobacteriales bacterium]|nr:alpha/beta hydrolase [Mycobacteriales bacterium]